LGKWKMSEGLRPPDVATLIDVGVNRGTPDLYEAFPNAYLVLVEPVRERIPAMEAIIADRAGEYVTAAAGAKKGTATFNVETARIGLSSFHGRLTTPVDESAIERRTVNIVTLDYLRRKHRLKGPFGIKIDTEGHELDVIRGSRKTLTKTAWVIAEVSIGKRFEGGYRADEMIGIMRSHGFAVADILKSTRGWADILFTPVSKRERH
jgi:FkbM family methyltransferase